MAYKIDYKTGAGNDIIKGTIEEAMCAADNGAAYTQQDIVIYNEDGKEVARRYWWGVAYTEGDCENPIKFGNEGYYGDWVV